MGTDKKNIPVNTDEENKSAEDERKNEKNSKQTEEDEAGENVEDEENEPEMIEIEMEELEQLKDQRDEMEEKYLRRTADLKNLRDRTKQEKQELMKYANDNLLADLLEVIDNFDRALQQMNFENEEVAEGVEMIKSQLDDLLDKYDVEPIKAEGEPFDPHKHEGMMREEREDLEQKEVLEVFKKGFKLHDRVLRPASVKVGVPVSSEDKGEAEE
ncbi:MAG: nucleotide exchange factor GrpE [bacterium]